MDYSRLVEVYLELEKTTKRLEKTEIISKFLKKCSVKELDEVVYLLQGIVFPEYDERKIGVSDKLIIRAIAQATGVERNEIEKLWRKYGDLGTAAEELVKRKKQRTLVSKKLTANKVYENIRRLASLEGAGTVSRKISLVAELLTSAKPVDARFIVRTVLDLMRIGVAKGIIRDSIAKAFDVDVKEVEHGLNLLNDSAEVAKLAKSKKLKHISFAPGRPVKVQLALLVSDVAEAFKALGKPAQCLPEGSLAYSNPEIRNIEDFKVEDKVVGLDGKFQKITKVFKREYNGYLVDVIPRYLKSFSLTPEHRVLCVKANKCSWSTRNYLNCRPNCGEQKYGCKRLYKDYKLDWVEAKNLKENCFLVFPKFKEISKFEIDLAKFYNHKLQYENDKIRPFHYNINGSWINRFINFNFNFFELMGWYLAEGCASSKNKDIRFTLGKTELSEAKKIKHLIEKVFSLKANIKVSNSVVVIRTFSAIVAKFLESSFGKNAIKKKIPDFILYSEPKFIKKFILAYIKGDGHMRDDRVVLTTASKHIAFQLNLMLTKLNILPQIIKQDNSKGFGNNSIYKIVIFGEQINRLFPKYYSKSYHRKGYWDDKDYFYIPIRKLDLKRYKGLVYNLETEDNSYLASTLIHNCEFKLDGFRLMVHKAGGKIRLFTRRLDEVSKAFPDVVEVVEKHVKGKNFILDCETVGFDRKTGLYSSFQKISQRIKRKYNIEKMMEDYPVELNIFDVLYHNNKNLMNEPLKKRRALLERVVKQKKRKIVLTKKLVTKNEDKAKKFYQEALDKGLEGVIIKKLDAKYRPGRYVGGWVKLKPVLEPLDLVIVGAEYGQGKRAGVLSSFILACKDGSKFKQCGMMGTGIKEKEGMTFKKFTKMLKPYILKTEGRRVEIKPKIVIEVKYEEIQKSPKYDSGYALRFPKFSRLRTKEKKSKDVNSLNDIKRIYKIQKARNK